MLPLARRKVIPMNTAYWTARMDAAVAEAHGADDAEARLGHYERAGRYSLNALCDAPFMLPHKGPATEGEREALRRPERGRGAAGRAGR